ncbi:MAG: penicillin-binding protein 2 [Hyphomicrobiaceae bacterium]
MLRPEAEEKRGKLQFRRRAFLIAGLQAAGFVALAARLHKLQVVDQNRYGVLSLNNRVAFQIVPPERGYISDRFGLPLATGEEAYRATLVPSFSPNVEEVVSLFARVVPLPEGLSERLIARARRQRPNEPIVLSGDLTFEQVAHLGLLAPQLPGVQVERAERRRYPQGTVGGHVVGHLGNVEQVALDDDLALRLPWIRVGRTGLEHGLEADVGGQSGRAMLEVDARGRIVRVLDRVEARRGKNVSSSLDIVLQATVERRLAEHRAAAAVVMDVRGGEVLAMASAPGYDPSRITDRMSVEDWRALASAKDDPLLNRAIAAQYPPGSTFKMVTALAALEAGVITPGERVACTGRHRYFDQTYRCWNRGGHGRMGLVDALRESCDVFFYVMAERVGIDRLSDMAHRLGLGETFDCGLTHQRPGVIPDKDWKRGHLGRGWLSGETLLAGIGQGYVLTTPLQLCVMTARIASGRAVAPTLVKHEPGLAPAAALDLTADALAMVRRGMYEVVNSRGGTGGRARLEGRPERIAGKTGTAQVRRHSRNGDDVPWEHRDHALFVAYAPFDDPRYAVSVIVEHGGAGGATAAPLARDIMEDVLDRDPLKRGDGTGVTAPAVPSPSRRPAAGEEEHGRG